MPTSSQYYAHVAGPLMGFWSRLNHFSNPQAEEFSWGAHKSRMSPAWVSYLQSDYQLMPSAFNAYWLGCCTLVQWFLERQRGDKVVGQKNLKAPSVSTFCHATVPSWSYTRIRGIAHADYLYVQTIYSSRFVIPDSTFLTRTYGLTFCIRNLPRNCQYKMFDAFGKKEKKKASPQIFTSFLSLSLLRPVGGG